MDYTVIIGVLTFAFAGAVWLLIFRLLGGWPEAHYRIWGISYFRQVIFEEDGTPIPHIIKTKKIHHSLPSFKNAGGEWNIDPDNDTRYHGRPSRYWNRGDSRQIPIKTWTKPEDRWDPKLIMSAYDDDSVERARGLGRKLPLDPIWILALCAIAIVAAGIAAYYAHDTYCAVKPLSC
jgi:hypothetical protein